MITPELTVSEDTLTFARTTPGKPVFLIVHVTADESDTQVTASTDLPDVFQLATDSRPLFGPTLTFSSGLTGIYVHVRYLPARTGVHEGTLVLESSIGRRMVVLHGRSGRLSSVQSNTSRALTRTVKPQQPATGVGKLAASAAGALLLAGLIYGGISYRCQLVPSLCREETVAGQEEPIRTDSPAEPVANKPSDAVAPGRTEIRPKSRPDEPTAKVGQSSRLEDRPLKTISSSPVRQSGTDRQLARPAKSGDKQPTNRSAEPVRPAKTVSESEESDLERALNNPSN